MLKLLKWAGYSLAFILIFLILYVAAAFLLSRIAVDAEKGPKGEVEVFLLSNGVHTDLVLPLKQGDMDWSRIVPVTHTMGKDSSKDFVAFGWGDKGFYLDTPTWADLKFSTAFKAATALSTAAIHATYHHRPAEGENCRKIALTMDQYQRLTAYILQSFLRDKDGNVIFIPTSAVYGPDDAFYEAVGSYHLFHTCNTWTNNGLKAAGQKACLWTPFDKGIFYQYNK